MHRKETGNEEADVFSKKMMLKIQNKTHSHRFKEKYTYKMQVNGQHEMPLFIWPLLLAQDV